jgi:hypothetical protein
MISFKDFVEKIHEAIINANETLTDKNISYLENFFIVPEEQEDLRKKMDKAIEESRKVSFKGKDASSEDHKRMRSALEDAKQSITGKGFPGEDNPLRARSVIVEYPHLTSQGTIEQHNVHVPLITLVPMDMHQIEKAKLTAEFEMEIVDNELKLNFGPRRSGKIFGKKSESTYGTLEITISPQEPSEGLKSMVEGYEKSLKSQIPH